MPGGAPANVAVGVARLGGDSGFIGRVGDNPFGRFMRHALAQEQVDVNYMRLDAAQRTSTVVVNLDSHGERTLPLWSARAPTCSFSPRSLPPFAAGQWLHVCSIALSAEPSRSTTFAAMEAIKRRRGLCQLRPQYPQRPVAGSAGPSRLSRPGAGPRRRHKTFGRGAGVYQRQRRHRQRHRPAERPLPADATAGDPGKAGSGRPARAG